MNGGCIIIHVTQRIVLVIIKQHYRGKIVSYNAMHAINKVKHQFTLLSYNAQFFVKICMDSLNYTFNYQQMNCNIIFIFLSSAYNCSLVLTGGYIYTCMYACGNKTLLFLDDLSSK